jgi:hypothetical protein
MPTKSQFEPRKKAVLGNPELANADHIRSGFPALDCALGGGLPRKGVVLLELDSHVNTSVAMAFLERLVSNFISTGNPVLMQPFDWMDPRSIMNYIGSSMPSGKKSLFKILWIGKVNGLSDNVMPLGKKQHASDPSIAAVVKMKQKYPGKILLNIMGTDIMQRSYGPEGVRAGFENLLSDLRAHADLSIAVISHSQDDMLEYLSEVSDMHIRVLMINGTLFLQSLVPESILYAIVFEKDGISLEPVV